MGWLFNRPFFLCIPHGGFSSGRGKIIFRGGILFFRRGIFPNLSVSQSLNLSVRFSEGGGKEKRRG
jgi:hypothetical protein